MKKGQGAIEYLMTYGWALLVIVVVGAALYASGVLNPASYVTNKCTAFTYFIWQNQKQETTNYTIELINGRDDITVTGVTVVEGTTTYTPVISGMFVDGVDVTATKKATTGRRITLVTGPATGKNAGDTFTSTVTVTYDTNTIAGIRDAASCTGKVQ